MVAPPVQYVNACTTHPTKKSSPLVPGDTDISPRAAKMLLILKIFIQCKLKVPMDGVHFCEECCASWDTLHNILYQRKWMNRSYNESINMCKVCNHSDTDTLWYKECWSTPRLRSINSDDHPCFQ